MDIRYLILSLTTRCSLECAYCYQAGGQEPMNREAVDMSPEVMEKAMEIAEQGQGPLHLQLTGGEPTLLPDLIQRIAERVRLLPRSCTMGIQTNGTGLDSDLVKLFRKYEIQVGISMDGPPAIQQALRGGVTRTLRGVQLLESMGVPFRVTAVVSQKNAGSLDRLLWMLAGFGQARGVGLDLLVRKGRAKSNANAFPESVDVATLQQGVEKMMKALLKINGKRKIPLGLRELDILKKQREKGKNSSSFCHASQGESMAVHPDGRLFPCSQTLGDPQFCSGTVWQPETMGLESLKRAELKLYSHPSCQHCPVAEFCPGECPSRLHYNGMEGRELVCALYRSIWKVMEPGSVE